MIGDLVAGIAARAAPEEAICARSRAWPMARRCATLPGRLDALAGGPGRVLAELHRPVVLPRSLRPRWARFAERVAALDGDIVDLVRAS
jgi:hypothetical protein